MTADNQSPAPDLPAGDRRDQLAVAIAALPLLAVAAAGGVLGHLQGGYYLSQWAPVGILIAVTLAWTWAVGARVVSSPGRIGRIGLIALCAYAAWSLLSIRWAPDRSAAWIEANRTLLYAGLVVAVALLARLRFAPIRMTVGVVALAPAALAATTLTHIGSDADDLFYNGRLLGSVGYYNGEATMLLASFWCSLWLMLDRRLPWLLRGLIFGGAMLAATTAVLAQSRGSLAAFVLAAIVFLALSPWRWRALLPLALAVGIVLADLHGLGAVYRSLDSDGAVARGAVDDAARRIWISAAIAAAFGTLWAAVDGRIGPRIDGESNRRRVRIAKWSFLVALAAVVTAGAAWTAHAYDVRDGVHDAWTRFHTPKVEEHGGGSSRLTNISNNGRLELWKTAVTIHRREPVHGVGAGNFEAFNYELRTSHGGYVRQPHNLTLEALAERGIVGAALLVAFFAAVLARGWHAARRCVSRTDAALAAALTAATVDWFAHAQLEWLWQLPGASWIAFVAAGLLLGQPWVAPTTDGDEAWDAEPRVPWRDRTVRMASAVVAVAVAASIAAPYLADRYVTIARAATTKDPAAARTALRHAEQFNPVSVDAALQRLDVARVTGDRAAGERAIRDLVERSPRHWAVYIAVSNYYRRIGDVDAATQWRLRARTHNPIGYDFDVDRDRERRGLPVLEQHDADATA